MRTGKLGDPRSGGVKYCNNMSPCSKSIDTFGTGLCQDVICSQTICKSTWAKKQRRVSEFASQTALQFYNILVTNHALRSIPTPTNENSMEAQSYSDQHCTLTDGDEISVQLRRKYNL